MWHVYIIKCKDKSLYTGISTDPDRRVAEHNSADKGAKYTRARRPVRIVYKSEFKNRSLAAKEEARIKKMDRMEKLDLIKKTKEAKSAEKRKRH